MIKRIMLIVLVIITIISCRTKQVAKNIKTTSPQQVVLLPASITLMSAKQELIRVISENDTYDGFTIWNCIEYIEGEKTLFQIGYFTSLDTNEQIGFIINDEPFIELIFLEVGTPLPEESSKDYFAPSAEIAFFSKKGLGYVWEWGNIEKGESFKIILDPDRSVRYYDFSHLSEGDSVKPSGVYKAYKRYKAE